MFNREFVCWLAGFVELTNWNLGFEQWDLSEYQRRVILAHAKLCQTVCKDEITLFIEYVLSHILGSTQISSDDFKTFVANEFKSYRNVLSSNELCYYMQGFFEIAQQQQWCRYWNKEAVSRMVQLCEQNQTGLSRAVRQEYAKWRLWIIELEQKEKEQASMATSSTGNDGSSGNDSSSTSNGSSSTPGNRKLYDCAEWQSKLNGIFMHTIDTSYVEFQSEEAQAQLQNIHDQYKQEEKQQASS
jgi:hypothetical protein